MAEVRIHIPDDVVQTLKDKFGSNVKLTDIAKTESSELQFRFHRYRSRRLAVKRLFDLRLAHRVEFVGNLYLSFHAAGDLRLSRERPFQGNELHQWFSRFGDHERLELRNPLPPAPRPAIST